MKIILSLLTFSLNLVYALELQETNVVLPIGIAQLDRTALKKDENKVEYTVNLYHNKNQSIIQSKPTNTNTIEGFMSNLIYSYINQDHKLFAKLMNKKSAKTIDLESEKFKRSFEYLKKIKKPHLKFVYEYQDGFIVSWSAIGLITDRILFLKKEKGNFKMYDLNIPKDDHFFWNMGLYFKFSPFKNFTPIKITSKKVDAKIKLNIELNEFKNWIYIYSSKTNTKNMIAVADNYANNKQYKDYDLNAKAMELKINQVDLAAMGSDLYMVESTYPIEQITKEIHKKAKKFKID